jgi:probable HAF family extracellular repeat protein
MRHSLGSARGWKRIVLPVLIGLAGVLTMHAQEEWTVTDLGTLGGLFGDAQDINDAGHVVGESSVVVSVDPFLQVDRAFRWTPSEGMRDLGTLGGSRSVAQAINNAGQVVGFADDASGSTRAFLWTADDGMMNLGHLGEPFPFPGFAFSAARDINELGQVVGVTSTPAGDRAFLWTAGSMISLGTLGGSFSSARAINDAGQVVGMSETANGEEHAFLWTAGVMVDLGTLGGSSSTAADINSVGQVVGRSATAGGDEHAFLWTGGVMVDLGTLGGNGSRSQAEGINEAGHVVGLFNDGDDHAFYWTPGDGMVELPTLTGIESAARAINNAGQLAGYGDIATGNAHAVIWTRATNPPSPEEQIASLGASVQDLVADGRLKPGQARGLNSPLENALRSLAKGQQAAACAQLGDFQAEVAKKVSEGALTPAEGAALITSVTAIRTALGC